MADVHVDQPSVSDVGLTTEDTNGSRIDIDAVVIPVLIPETDIQEWLNLYDPASSSSPLAADSRRIARAVLDALRLHRGL